MGKNDRISRQKYIRGMIDCIADVALISHREIAEKFGCSESVVKTDISNYISNRGQVAIYALADPDTHQVRYVGQTAGKLQTRVVAHVRDSLNGKESNVAKREWIISLSASKKNPLPLILEFCKPESAHERERWWIGHYLDEGAALLNISHNGFALKLGDKFAKQEADAHGNGVGTTELWTVEEITRTHVKLRADDGGYVRLIR